MTGQRHAAPNTDERQRERSRRFVPLSPVKAEASPQISSATRVVTKKNCPLHPQPSTARRTSRTGTDRKTAPLGGEKEGGKERTNPLRTCAGRRGHHS